MDPGCTDGTDIAAMLGEARYEDGSPMTEQDLRDELVTLLTDGPTSSLLSWAFERILRHPEQYARLRAEIDAGEEDVYLDAVVKETMRLCPAAPIVVRRLLEPMELGGYTIPAGTTVAPCVHLVHRRPDIYPEPLRFRPERFLERPGGDLHVDPLRRGRTALPGGQLRAAADEAGDRRPSSARSTCGRSTPRSERARKSAIAFVPHRHALVIAARRPTSVRYPAARQSSMPHVREPRESSVPASS